MLLCVEQELQGLARSAALDQEAEATARQRTKDLVQMAKSDALSQFSLSQDLVGSTRQPNVTELWERTQPEKSLMCIGFFFLALSSFPSI